MAEYIGRRIVPTHGGVWNETKEYEELVIVLDEESGDSYISRIPVPSGTALDDEEYWMLFSIYSEQIQEALDAIEKTSEEMVAYVDKTAASLTEYVQDTATELTEQVEAAEDLTESNADTLNDRMDNLEARLDANVTASTDSDADYAAEVVDARVDDNDTEHDSLGANVRALGKIRTLSNVLESWTWKDGYIADENGDLKSGYNGWSLAHLIPVVGDRVIVNGSFGYMSGSDEYNNIVCYDRNRDFISGCFRAESGATYDYYEVELPDDTAYISLTTGTTKKSSAALYLPADTRALQLLDDRGDWQWLNGQVNISWSGTDLSVAFTGTCYLCRRRAGSEYVQTVVDATNDLTTEWTRSGWWGIYFQSESGTTDARVSEDDSDADPVIHVESTTTSWADLFTPDRFVIAVFYSSNPVYVAPSVNGTYINNVDYGNPAYRAYQALNLRSAKLYLASGQITIDTEANTIQITKQILGVADNAAYVWLAVNDEPVEINEATEGSEGNMRIMAYDTSSGTINMYETSAFRALGSNGYYLGSWYGKRICYPQMNPSLSIVLDGTTYSAGELFAEEDSTYGINTYVEKRYQDAIDDAVGSAAVGTHTLYLASGAFTFDQDTTTYEGTIQVTSNLLGVAENQQFIWVYKNDEAYDLNSPATGSLGHMRILGYDAESKTINLFRTSEFLALGTNGYYIASWYSKKFYNAHMNPDVQITYNGTTYSAGDLFDTASASYVPQAVKDYLSDYDGGDTDEDDLGDIVSPSHWDCMEGRQFSMFFDCLSRHEGRMNLYRIVNSMGLERNEYCLNYTPASDDENFSVTIRRLNENTMETAETKSVAVKVHHPLSASITKNVCICGDSLVDNKYLAQEVWDLLDEDGDCVINHIGTRGGTGYEHEGRGGWTWARYLQDYTDSSGRSNAFWDSDNERLDFQKYCENNGYEGIDYFLIALGTNDVSQGTTLYNCEDDVQKFIDYAKEFIDALLDEETGFPDCKVGIGLCGPGADYAFTVNNSMAIFRRSINTLNLALIKNFDDGAYHENVTCFAHGLRTDRMHAFPYSDSATTDRFEETSRTLTNSIHPSSRGYQAWADGYYCQIRAWLEEDAEEVAQG